MATTRSFSTMLNQYLANDLLKEELIRRDFLLTKVEKDDTWLGGDLIVPFKAAGASSVNFGQLVDATLVSEDIYVRGSITTQPEMWAAMIFNGRDIMEHGQVNEQNFLKLLPDTIEDFMMYIKSVVSINLLNGAAICKATADGTAAGLITVPCADRFVVGQAVIVDDDNSSPSSTGYIVDINMNTGVLHIQNARSSGSNIDLSGYTVSQNAALYNLNQQLSGFSGLKSMLLSSANGGSSTLYGQTKTAYPYLQAINVSGADVTSVNILEKIFDALVTVQRLGKGKITDVVMSYKNFGNCMKIIENSKGAFNVVPNSQKTSQYGWMELSIGTIKGMLNLVAVQEMDDDSIYFIDWRALKFYSNGFFRKNKSPDGNEYFVQRATTGYSYLIDICLFGDLVLLRPSYCGILYSISY
ncbi:MAG: hypothetical protein KGL39_59455 [Patescibacteria group bacterium]|nr:hypothetical protein [Patescibacteria group bacterium]